jgi:mannose-6-phosphate isomerase-like protein (cupin superfamily)
MTRKLYVIANRNDKSSFVEEGAAPSNAFTAVPGFDPAVIWGTSANPSTNWDGKKIFDKPNVMAEVGGTRLWVVTFPPDSVMAAPGFDPQAAGAEYGKRLPGLAERFEPENPGMHTTDTVDYDIVLDGEITLEVDGGQTRVLKQGDIAVQYGARHGWRNHSSKPATLIFVLVGATRPNA